MTKKKKNELCCGTEGAPIGGCKVESLISVDERGQMVLPKELRDKANIKAGSKLALMSWEKEGKVCCISLIKVDDLTEIVKGVFGPLMEEIFHG